VDDLVTVPDVPRPQVLAYRVAAQQLDRSGTDATDLAVVDLGLQDTPSGSASQTLAARLPDGADVDTADGRRWTSVWGVRGAPHVHRRRDLRATAAALWPIDDDDAAARLAGTGTHLRKLGIGALDVLAATVAAYEEVVTGEVPKGEASAALTQRVPDAASSWCRSCEAHHISDQLMRVAALPGGARLVPGGKATLAPIPRWPGAPTERDGLDEVVLAYLTLHGPAAKGDVASYLGTTQRAIAPSWPEDRLEEVTVDGRRAWIAADALDALMDPPTPRLTRLLPRSDPWMLARDREVTVPEKARHKVLWPMLGHPGAVLVDGEVVGAWRTKASAKRLTVTVEAFDPIPRRARAEIDDEAERIAACRGIGSVEVALA
jgi:hypothetical protein